MAGIVDPDVEHRAIVEKLKRASVVDELVRALSGPHDQHAATIAMRLTLLHLAPESLEELDQGKPR